MNPEARRHQRLRGGWDVGPDEFKSLGFTIGLPPGIYVPQTKQISDTSQRFEECDQQFAAYDSNFAVQERSALFEAGKIVRCFVSSLPPNITEARLKQVINQTLFKKNLTSQPDVVYKVSINSQGQFAFVDFEKPKDAEKFVELKDSFIIDGFTLKIRKSTMATTTETSLTLPHEHVNGLIIQDKSFFDTSLESEKICQEIKEIVSKYAIVDKVQMPKFNDIRLGYVIVDLFNPDYVDFVILKLKLNHNLQARRCFVQSGEYPRDISEIKSKIMHTNLNKGMQKEKLYSVYPKKDLTIADIFNLDVDIATIDAIVPYSSSRFLKIYNVLKRDTPSEEVNTVIGDMKEECEKYGKVLNAYAETTFPKFSSIIPTPIVIEYEKTEDAVKAQKIIAGLQYCGRALITCLEDPRM
ncbi:hypothetical protein TVAG_056670 [Trichomonas vaginalis G3]|uniref:RRM domain-containing protein n=1 Tax=Trichomonas vaginalis (strain ATCC PRA-98 / G3) TaxID=412133 RepID=A2ECM6_TRIV3|nr:RNA-binding protein family [Trichomonas vaginalis G3]EAY09623.1 hypothetical protein TVAG_056670 [Trichomonas vaginalis G3]KAI5502134.1 RNA-binding protein family [Trichomonas vaginalis G3]|eukprot:XP_001321846.1 hypothetical protein [Trichomonas vaginalis G3]